MNKTVLLRNTVYTTVLPDGTLSGERRLYGDIEVVVEEETSYQGRYRDQDGDLYIVERRAGLLTSDPSRIRWCGHDVLAARVVGVEPAWEQDGRIILGTVEVWDLLVKNRTTGKYSVVRCDPGTGITITPWTRGGKGEFRRRKDAEDLFNRVAWYAHEVSTARGGGCLLQGYHRPSRPPAPHTGA